MSKFVLTAELQLQAPKNVKQIVNQIQSQLNNININANIQNAGQAVGNLNNIQKAANQAATSGEKMGKSFRASIKRFSALAIATRAVSLFTNGLGGAIKEAIAFERELVKISQVTGKSISQLGKLTSTVSNLATGLGVSSTSLLGVSRILAQTGLSARDTQVALSALAKTELAPTFDNITQTAEGAVAILNQFGQGARSLEAQLGSLNAVAGQFAVESGDLIAVIRRTGGVFKSAGGDLNELIALFTSVRATTRESAESIATGLRTIFTRIQRPETIEYLRQFGVELEDVQGKFVGPYQAVEQLSAALGGLGERDLTFVQIAEELGGFRQIGKVLPLLQQFGVAQDALNVAQSGSGSLADDAAKAQAALAIQITKVKEEFFELIRGITSTDSFQLMADTVLSLASAMIRLAEAVKPVLPLLGAFAAIKMVKGAGGFLGGLTGGAMGFNRGGSVPGSGNRDTVPAMLTPGEFVIRKSAVEAFGAGNLSDINKYAKGDVVKSVSAKRNPMTLSSVDNTKGLDNRAKASMKGTMFEIDFMKQYGVSNITSGAFPDVTNKSVAKRIGGPEAEALELKYADTTSTRAKYRKRLLESGKESAEIPMVVRKASGGGINGTDTVPALLTPGEFVVNKKSAQNYGYGNLRNINKYARGGMVDHVQRFANGGGPVMRTATPMASSSSQGDAAIVSLEDLTGAASDLKEQIDGNNTATKEATDGTTAMFLAFGAIATGLQALTPVIDETSSQFDYLIAEFTGFGMQLVAVIGLIQSLGGLQNIIAVTTGVFKALGVAMGVMKAASVANAAVTAVNTTATGANTVAKGTETIASVQLAMAKLLELAASPTGQLILLGTAIAALIASFYLAASASAKFHKAQMEAAIEEGDVEKAGREASQATVQMGIAGPDKALIATARAQAAVTKANMDLEKATKKSAAAMKRFEKGAGSIADVFSANAEAVKSAAQARAEADKAMTENTKQLSSQIGNTIREIGAYLSFGFVDSVGDKETAAKKANKDLDNDAKKAEKAAVSASQPAMNVLQKQVAAAGGSFEDFMMRLRSMDGGDDLYKNLVSLDMLPEVANSFKNVSAEADRTRAAFKAMTLGFRPVQGAASAAALGARTITGGLSGDVPLENVIDVLETGITNAAQGMSFDTFNNALGYAAEQLMVAGASAKSVEGFGQMFQAIFTAQKQFANATQDAKNAMMKDFMRGSGGAGTIGDRRDALADAIIGNLPGVSKDIKKRLGDVIRNAEIDPEDMEMLASGNPAALDKVMGELGEKIGSQVLPALEDLKSVQEAQAAVAKKLVDSQMKLIAAQSKQIDVTIKANKYIEEFGGAEFTPAMERQAILDKANLPNSGRRNIGSSGGTANEIVGDFKVRRGQIAREQAARTRTEQRAASGDVRAQATVNTPEFKKRGAEIDSITKNEVQTHEALLKTIQAEIKAIEAKTAAEKKAADALLSGSYEDFVDQMAGIGAAAAVRLGDQSVIKQFGRKDFGRGVENLEAQKKAGVRTVNGQNIDSVISQTASAGFQAAGMNSRDADNLASKAYESSPEIEALKQAGQIIAEDMKRSSELQVNSASANIAVLESAFTRMTGLVSAAADKLNRIMSGGASPPSRQPSRGSSNSSTSTGRGRMARGGRNGPPGNLETAGSGGAIDTKAMSTIFEQFNAHLAQNISRLEALSIKITIPPIELNINFNGAGILESLRRYVGEEMLLAIKKEITEYRVGPNGRLVRGNGGQLPK